MKPKTKSVIEHTFCQARITYKKGDIHDIARLDRYVREIQADCQHFTIRRPRSGVPGFCVRCNMPVPPMTATRPVIVFTDSCNGYFQSKSTEIPDPETKDPAGS